MESLGLISKVDSPSEWCAPMVPVVPKKESGKVRICVDLKALNESVLHEVYPLPKVDETLAKLAGATRFSKLDANSRWLLANSSIGRYTSLDHLLHSSGQVLLQQASFWHLQCSIVIPEEDGETTSGTRWSGQVDDVLVVYGKDSTEHDERLLAVLKRVEAAKVTLNKEK